MMVVGARNLGAEVNVPNQASTYRESHRRTRSSEICRDEEDGKRSVISESVFQNQHLHAVELIIKVTKGGSVSMIMHVRCNALSFCNRGNIIRRSLENCSTISNNVLSTLIKVLKMFLIVAKIKQGPSLLF